MAENWKKIKDLNFVDPQLRTAAQIILDKARERGLDIRITETYRTRERQKALKEKGASQTEYGWHTVGKAIDFGIFNDRGEYLGKAEDYEPLGDIISEVIQENPDYAELIWGGDWGWDYGHVEHHPGFKDTESKLWYEQHPEYKPPASMLTGGQ